MAKLGKHVVVTTRNLARGKPIHASSYPDTVGPDEANDGDFLERVALLQELFDLGQGNPASPFDGESERPGTDRREGDALQAMLLGQR